MSATFNDDEIRQIERLIRISKEKPLLPENFVPWGTPEEPHHTLLPEHLVSLHGMPVYDTLSAEQKRELARLEVVQSMYAYCWSEGLFCIFMSRYIQDRQPDDLERRFLLREIIEECRHMDMFASAIEKLGREPIPMNWLQRMFGNWTARYLPDDFLFVSCIAIEIMADRYGDHLRHADGAYPVLQKLAQLHNIEEARHILFTKAILKKYIHKAGPWRRTWYSLIILANMRFFQNAYVHSEIYRQAGIQNPKKIRKEAFSHYQKKFAADCLDTLKDFIDSFNGFNIITKPLWRKVMKLDI